MVTAKKTTKKAKNAGGSPKGGHKAGVPLSKKHRAAIGAGRTHPLIRKARQDAKAVRKTVIDNLRDLLRQAEEGRVPNAQDLADRLGMARTTLYVLLEEGLRRSFGEILDEAALEAARSPSPAGAVAPWWMSALEETDGTRIVAASSMQGSVPDHECRIAATLLWHEWASKQTGEIWANPLGPILCELAREGRKVPNDEDLRAAPSHLLTIAAYLAGESLDTARTKDARLEEARHMAAFRWLVKLVEVGCLCREGARAMHADLALARDGARHLRRDRQAGRSRGSAADR